MPHCATSQRELAAVRATARAGAHPTRVAARAAPAEAPAWRSPSRSPTSPGPGRSTQITGALSRFAEAASTRCTDAILLQLERDGQLALGGDPAGRRLHRARHGQARRRRAQLLERHRPDPALRPRGAGARPATTQLSRHFVRGRAHAGAAHVGAHRRRLCLPHRPAAAARSRLDAARHLGPGGRALLRERRPELGARRHDQGAPGGRRPRRGAAFLAELQPYIWRKHLDFAAIDDIHSIKRQIHAHTRRRRRSRSRATTSSSAAAASARSSSSPRPSS